MAGRALGAVVLALQTGVFAIFGAKPQIVSQIHRVAHDELQIVQHAKHSRAPITHYVLTEGKPLHVVLVRDDFRSFSHVHPAMSPDGTFRTRVALDAGHRFYAYVASQPAGYPKQVFRFVLQAGAPPHHLDTTLSAPHRHSMAGPFPVTLDTAVLDGKPSDVLVHTTDRAALHSVLVNTSTLTYAHVDGTLLGGGCCTYRMQMPALQRGIYRMWIQLERGGHVLVAPFTIAVR